MLLDTASLRIPSSPSPSWHSSGVGLWKGMAELCSWWYAVPGAPGAPHGAPTCPSAHQLGAGLAGTCGTGRAHVRGTGMGRPYSEWGQKEEGCCLFFHLLSPHKPPFLPFSPNAGMKQPHLEIPSLLKAGSSRQLVLSGKTLHHSATGWLGEAPGMGAWSSRRDAGH